MTVQTMIKNIRRTIISDKPRITKFNINWSDASSRKK